MEKTKEKKRKIRKVEEKKVILKKNWKKNKKNKKKQGKVRKKQKKKKRITVDYCCNPQWNVCGEQWSLHHLNYVLIAFGSTVRVL